MRAIAQLRQIFEQTDSQTSPIKRETELLIPAVAAALRSNVSIQRRYPTFWQQLLANRLLQDLFLEFVDLLDSSGEWCIPQFPPASLNVLPPVPELAFYSADHWHIQWYQSPSQLNDLIEKAQSSVVLFESVVDLENGELEVLLRLSGGESAEQHPILHIIHRAENTVPLVATLQWGQSEQTLPVHKHTTLFEMIAPPFCEECAKIDAPLQLIVETNRVNTQTSR